MIGLYGAMEYAARQPVDSLSPPSLPARGYQFARPQQELAGFAIQVHRAGRPLLLLSGDKFTVRKKKVGLFRFGLAKEAVIEQAFLTFTAPQEKVRDAGVNSPADHTWQDLAQDLSSLLPDRRLSGLACKPISISIAPSVQEEDPPVRLTAEHAEVRAERRAVLLRGKVRVVAGEASLTSDELAWFPADGRIEAEHSYTLITESGRVDGQGLQSDIFLHSAKKMK